MGIVLMKFPGVNAAGLLPAFTDHWARLRQDEETERQYERENSANLGRGIRGAGQAIAGGITDWKDKRYNEQQAAKRAEAGAAKTAEQREYDDLVRAQTVQRRRGAATGPTMIGAGDPQPAPTSQPATTQPAAQQVVPPSKQPAMFQRQQPVPQQQVSLVPNQPASLPGQPGATGRDYLWPKGFEPGRGDVDFINDTDLTIRQKQHWFGFEDKEQALREAKNLTPEQRMEKIADLRNEYGAGRPITRKKPKTAKEQAQERIYDIDGVRYYDDPKTGRPELLGEKFTKMRLDQLNIVTKENMDMMGPWYTNADGGQQQDRVYRTRAEAYKAAVAEVDSMEFFKGRAAHLKDLDIKRQQAEMQQALQKQQQRQAQATGRPSGTPPLPPQRPGGRPSTPNPANMRGLPGQGTPSAAAQAMQGATPKVAQPPKITNKDIERAPLAQRPILKAQKAQIDTAAKIQKLADKSRVAQTEAQTKVQKILDEALIAGRDEKNLTKDEKEKITRIAKKAKDAQEEVHIAVLQAKVTKEMKPLLAKINRQWRVIRKTYDGQYTRPAKAEMDKMKSPDGPIMTQNPNALRAIIKQFTVMVNKIKGKSK